MIRNKVITTVRPNDEFVNNKIIYGQYSFGIEPTSETYYQRRIVMTEKTFESVKQDYIDKHNLKEFDVWLGDEATPELLEKELKKIDDIFVTRGRIDRITLLEAKIERYEKLISEIGCLGTSRLCDLIDGTQSEEVSALKKKILNLTQFAKSENVSHDIEFAKRKGVIE